ncbi:MAG: hypothetical protein KY476_06745 [Planctomycetes bacterium]|nr:hypothetical protein [Planctomycetota bacterium]
MHHGIRIIDLGEAPKAVRKFFDALDDEPVVVEHDGRAVYVIQPAQAVVGPAAERSQLAGEMLKDVEGAWTDIPQEICDAVAAGNRG